MEEEDEEEENLVQGREIEIEDRTRIGVRAGGKDRR